MKNHNADVARYIFITELADRLCTAVLDHGFNDYGLDKDKLDSSFEKIIMDYTITGMQRLYINVYDTYIRHLLYMPKKNSPGPKTQTD